MLIEKLNLWIAFQTYAIRRYEDNSHLTIVEHRNLVIYDLPFRAT
jgi:hypothetical protein